MKEKDIPQIPGYVIEKKLGEGGMANVYLAVQEKLEREVAIKILNPILLQDEKTLKRFKNEANSAAKLANPNIITIYDVGEYGDLHYIVMEYLKESLRDRIKARGKLEPEEALGITKKIAAALHEAHKNSIIHRDIKPDNVMFRPDESPVLLDFGIARALDLNTRLTHTGISIGTPHYMSPEQCRGEEIDGRSDLYSLGVLLFELLTGNVPYTAEYSTGLIYLHTHGPVPRLTGHLQKYQPLIDMMMAKNKEHRVKNGLELVKRIQKLEKDQTPLEEELETAQTRTLQFLHKGKRVLPWVLIAMVVLGILGYFLLLQAPGRSFSNTPKVPLKIKDFITPAWHLPNLSLDNTDSQAGQEEKKLKEKQYNELIIQAKKFFEDRKYQDALDTLGKARKLKPSSEIDSLESNTLAKIREQEKEIEYRNHLNLADKFFKEGNFAKSLEYIAKARPLKNTAELDRLEKEVKKKLEEKEKIETKKVKSVNFANLPREIIARLNESIKRIEIPGLEPKVIVGGEIEINLSIAANGSIEVKYSDYSRLIVNPDDEKEIVRTMISKAIEKFSIEPLKDENGESLVVENWRKTYTLATYRGKIILY